MASNVDVVRGIYDAFASGDLQRFLDTLHPTDLDWVEAQGLPYGPGPYRSAEEVANRVIIPLMTDVPDFAVALEEILSDGDPVVVLARYTGTATGTGKRIDLPAVHLWDVRDGKAQRYREFVDTVKFREAVPNTAATAA